MPFGPAAPREHFRPKPFDIGKAVRVLGSDQLGWLLAVTHDGAEALISFADGTKETVPSGSVTVTSAAHYARDYAERFPECEEGQRRAARRGAQRGAQVHDELGVLVAHGSAREDTPTVRIPAGGAL